MPDPPPGGGSDPDRLEEIPAPGDGAPRQPSREDLGHRHEIRANAVRLLSATRRPPKTGDHLVHDQADPPGRRERPQVLQEPGGKRDRPGGRAARLHDYGGDLRVSRQGGTDDVEVDREDHGLTGGGGGDAGRDVGVGGRLPRADRVMPPVEVPLELYHLPPARRRAGEPEREQRGLRAGTGEAHHLHARDQGLDALRPFDLQQVVGARVRAERDLAGDGVHQRRVRVPEDQGSVAHGVVHVVVPVEVPRALAAHGASVVCADLNEAGARTTADLIGKAGGNASAERVDIAKEDEVRRLFAAAGSGRASLDVVVTTPSINVRKPVVTYTAEDLDRVLTVNLKGTFYVLREAGRRMAEQGRGSIIAFASIRAQVVEPGQSVSSATKAGTVQLVRTLAAELGPKGVRVNAVAPGGLPTPPTRPVTQ